MPLQVMRALTAIVSTWSSIGSFIASTTLSIDDVTVTEGDAGTVA